MVAMRNQIPGVAEAFGRRKRLYLCGHPIADSVQAIANQIARF